MCAMSIPLSRVPAVRVEEVVLGVDDDEDRPPGNEVPADGREWIVLERLRHRRIHLGLLTSVRSAILGDGLAGGRRVDSCRPATRLPRGPSSASSTPRPALLREGLPRGDDARGRRRRRDQGRQPLQPLSGKGGAPLPRRLANDARAPRGGREAVAGEAEPRGRLRALVRSSTSSTTPGSATRRRSPTSSSMPWPSARRAEVVAIRDGYEQLFADVLDAGRASARLGGRGHAQSSRSRSRPCAPASTPGIETTAGSLRTPSPTSTPTSCSRPSSIPAGAFT